MTLTDPAWNLDDYTATPQQQDPYTYADAYSNWVGEQPDGDDTSWEAWEEYCAEYCNAMDVYLNTP